MRVSPPKRTRAAGTRGGSPASEAVIVCLAATATIAVFLVAGPLVAGTPRIADPVGQAAPLGPQAEPPRAPPDPIVAPTSSAPALVAWEEDFEITVSLAQGQEPGKAGQWLVALSTRSESPWGEPVGLPVSMRFTLQVREVRPGEGGLAVLTAGLPARVPRDVYHLEVAGPDGLRARRIYAVRVLGDPERREKFSMVLIADNQLRDPSTGFSGADLNNGAYPHLSDDDAQAMFMQQISEISFLDPDFIINLGDLVFGVDYRQEYRLTLSLWWQQPLACFMIPGNHDGLALYELALKEGWWIEALKSVRCAKYIIDGEVTAATVFKVLDCLLGDLKKILFQDLAQDGLDYWRRLLGAVDYSFDVGQFHFAGLNSYAGSPERRHAFVLGLDFVGIDLGAATVDNYGGTVTAAQLAWLKKDLEYAEAGGKTIVLFLHHDPRGTRGERWGRAYHANLPFPTEPLGLRKFQEWNYDGEWDSDPGDGRGVENQTKNNAVSLLRLIARYADYVFTGHIHDDEDTLIEAGQELVAGSGIRARQDIRYVRVTTASSTPDSSDGYWGYRLARASGRQLQGLVYYPEFEWPSLPSGNLWVVGNGLPSAGLAKRLGGNLLFAVHSGLPREARGMLRAFLLYAPEGYRFPAEGGEVRLADVGRGEDGRYVYYLEVRVPAVRSGQVPVPEGEEEQVRIRYERAAGNRAPEVSFSVPAEDLQPGRTVRFDGGGSKDPEGKKLVQYIWDFGDGHGARGSQVTHVYRRPGEYDVSLTAIDDCGAIARFATRLSVEPAPSCAVGSGACAAASVSLGIFLLVVVGWWWVRRRRGKS